MHHFAVLFTPHKSQSFDENPLLKQRTFIDDPATIQAIQGEYGWLLESKPEKKFDQISPKNIPNSKKAAAVDPKQ